MRWDRGREKRSGEAVIGNQGHGRGGDRRALTFTIHGVCFFSYSLSSQIEIDAPLPSAPPSQFFEKQQQSLG